ncbi:MAG: M24 family metallopeptidase [Pirellulales bacterium]
MTTLEIDLAVEKYFASHGAIPLFKGVPGKTPFPAVCCISTNEEVVHGIPKKRRCKKATSLVSIPVAA